MECCFEESPVWTKEVPQNAKKAYLSYGEAAPKKTALEFGRHKKPAKQLALRYAQGLERRKQWSATIVVHQSLSSTEEEFNKLAVQWKRETSLHSSLSKKFMNPSYQRIVAMGKEALPFIFKKLDKEPGHWFYALRFIVGKDVAEDAQNFDCARKAWLAWGRKHSYL